MTRQALRKRSSQMALGSTFVGCSLQLSQINGLEGPSLGEISSWTTNQNSFQALSPPRDSPSRRLSNHLHLHEFLTNKTISCNVSRQGVEHAARLVQSARLRLPHVRLPHHTPSDLHRPQASVMVRSQPNQSQDDGPKVSIRGDITTSGSGSSEAIAGIRSSLPCGHYFSYQIGS